MTSLSLHAQPEELHLGKPSTRRMMIIAAILLLHVALAYSLLNGMAHKLVPAVPKELFVSIMMPNSPPPAAPIPQPKPIKTLNVAQASFAPPMPTIAPTENQIVQAVATTPEIIHLPSSEIAKPVPSLVAATNNQPKTISGLEYLSPPHAEYPALSRRRGEEGKVVLRVRVNEKGHPEIVEIHRSSGSSRLDEAGRFALLHASFKPYVEDGKPQTVYAFATINFDLDA